MADPFDFERFVQAQDPVMPQVLAELAAGRKRTHWMWFVFPQLAGLGHSPTARHYALPSVAAAEAFLAHAVLGPRLVRCTGLVNAVPQGSVHDIFGSPDDLKFRSSLTLFARAANTVPVFTHALLLHFRGSGDPSTLAKLAGP